MRLGKIMLSAAALLTGVSLSLDAQIYTSGENPAGVRWQQLRTDNFKLIFPEGLDSLAKVYATQLELWREPIGRSIGFTPNCRYRRPMPVVLQAFKADNNGMVSWLPRRMELYTVPDAYSPGAIPSETELAIHEGRHVAQMQLGRTGIFRPIGWLTGELSTGASAALYGGQVFLEGDAVVAETALTSAGRGRTADFLEYMRVCFGSGDFRNFYRWRYGSMTRYTPDYYKVGYMTLAGTRYFYDAPDFTDRFYSRVADRRFALPLFNLQITVKEVSGKRFRDAWAEVAEGYAQIWAQERSERAPFIEDSTLTSRPKRYVSYSRSTLAGDTIYAVKSGMNDPATLVAISSDGSERVVCAFASTTSALRYDASSGRLWWSETIPDARWGMKETSRIRYMEVGSTAKHSLTRGGRYYNPAPDGRGTLAVTEYPLRGGSAAVLLSAGDGRMIGRYAAPDSMQVVECGWMGGKLYASAITPEGFGIYGVEEGYREILDASPMKIKQLQTSPDGSELLFVCDRSGVNELYSLSLGGDGAPRILRLSSTPDGAADFVLMSDVRMAFTRPEPRGRMIHTAARDYAVDVKDWTGERHQDPVSEKLSEQERMLALRDEASGNGTVGTAPVMDFGQVKRYSKLLNALHIHSWLPLGFSYDSVMEASYDEVYETISPGASVLFQNLLGTVQGLAGYSLNWDEENELRHTLHANVTYSGLYPVIEASVDFNDRAARHYTRRSFEGAGSSLGWRKLSSPSLSGQVKVYVPLDFSGGGWYRGVIPQFSVSMTNDVLDKSLLHLRRIRVWGNNVEGFLTQLEGVDAGSKVFVGRAVTSLRGYTMRPTAPGSIYPRLGIGIEGGLAFRPGMTDLFSPTAFTYVYGYVPGVLRRQGAKITALTQLQTGDGIAAKESYLVSTPRGFADSQAQQYLVNRYDSQTKFTLDYALGSMPLDWSGFGPFAYVKSLDFALHADLGLYGRKYAGDVPARGTFYSAGADIAVRLGNILWVPFDCRVGVTWSYNGGSLWAPFSSLQGALPSRNYFGAIFTADL
ncbi:MAG: hypothetical protein Q4B16_07215 [Bacteroidia bacterium]|nr:hypothetical protein [Bacteroidia bacterium]